MTPGHPLGSTPGLPLSLTPGLLLGSHLCNSLCFGREPKARVATALHSLRDALAKFSKILEDFGLPTPSVAFDRLETNRLFEVERNYNVEVLQAEVVMAIESLNDGQSAAYNGVIDVYAAHHVKVIFIDGPSGTGKTYIENLILNVVHSRDDIALVVASSGIAALLLSRR